MASSLCKTDAARTLPIVDLVASTWPELADYIVHDGGIQAALSSTQNRYGSIHAALSSHSVYDSHCLFSRPS